MYSHPKTSTDLRLTPSGMALTQWRSDVQQEAHDLLAWWMQHMSDRERGGFFGQMKGDGTLMPDADRGMVMLARVLWTFSEAGHLYGNPAYRVAADQACDYLLEYGWDKVYGGIFWSLDAQGQPVETRKQVYAQAFALYGLAAHHRLTGRAVSLDRALELFDLIERFSLDQKKGGYFEAFSRTWEPIDDLRLSEKDANEAKTMNTHLHVMEAYSTLYQVTREARVGKALSNLIQLFLEKFIAPAPARQHLFFDENWNLKSQTVSYGHDIECSWLLVEAAESLGDAELLATSRGVAVRMAREVWEKGLDTDGGIFNEYHPAHGLNAEKHWWPQAEAMVGFMNAWQLSGDPRYLTASEGVWKFITSWLKDPVHGEWHWRVDENHEPVLSEDKAGPWKGPYHNVRACMEMWRRLG